MILGLVCGFLAALLQSFCYVVSGAYVRRTGHPGWTLAAPERMVCIVPCGLLAFFFRPTVAGYSWGPVLTVALICLVMVYVGDAGLFQMQKDVEPSRVAPLQALKIPAIALVSFWAFGKTYAACQLVGIGLVLVAAALLMGAGRVIPIRAWVWLLVCVSGYACSDVALGRALEFTAPSCGSVLRSALFVLGVTHFVSGSAAVPICLSQHATGFRLTSREWLCYALPYGCLWLGALVFLFAAFSLAGVVPGAIAQSTRGLISVALGWLLARQGFGDIESRVPRTVFLRRLLAAALVIAAVVVYSL